MDITDEKDLDNAKLKLRRENSFSHTNLKLELSVKYSEKGLNDSHDEHHEDGIYTSTYVKHLNDEPLSPSSKSPRKLKL